MITLKHNKTPTSTQHIYGYMAFGRHKLSKYMTAKAKKFKEDFLASINKQLPMKYKPMSGDLEMKYFLTFPDKRKRDCDNYWKLVLDTMNGVVYEDDSQIQKLIISKKIVKGKSGIVIKIKEIKWKNTQ